MRSTTVLLYRLLPPNNFLYFYLILIILQTFALKKRLTKVDLIFSFSRLYSVLKSPILKTLVFIGLLLRLSYSEDSLRVQILRGGLFFPLCIRQQQQQQQRIERTPGAGGGGAAGRYIQFSSPPLAPTSFFSL